MSGKTLKSLSAQSEARQQATSMSEQASTQLLAAAVDLANDISRNQSHNGLTRASAWQAGWLKYRLPASAEWLAVSKTCPEDICCGSDRVLVEDVCGKPRSLQLKVQVSDKPELCFDNIRQENVR